MNANMKPTSLGDTTGIVQMGLPRTLVFGNGCSCQCKRDLLRDGAKSALIISTSYVEEHFAKLATELKEDNIAVTVFDGVDSEPTSDIVERSIEVQHDAKADCVIGIGGGSVLDVAKLVAALHDKKGPVAGFLGMDLIPGRSTRLACIPTTSGTGSEVSPNSIIINSSTSQKQGAVSPHLVPDAVYVDPELTVTVPPQVTAATGMDALVHCVEAYVNRFAHPMIDTFAIEGIRLITHALLPAINDGRNLHARSMLALGSLYGGMCLGPVNTAAVHALAYPLATRLHLPHGMSNALLLFPVMEFNLPASYGRLARLAEVLGIEKHTNDIDTARQVLQFFKNLTEEAGFGKNQVLLDVSDKTIRDMAADAMEVTRLLNNNPRTLTHEDAFAIYLKAFRA